MSGGAGIDETDGGSGSSAQTAAQQSRPAPGGHQDDQWALDEHGVWRKRQRGIAGSRPPRSRWKLGVGGRIAVAGAVAVALSLAAVFGFSTTTAPGFHPTATKPALAAKQTAEAFLDAWQKGQIRKAASFTDHPAAAAAALTSYRDGLHLSALHLAVHSATADGNVAFSVAATVGLAATLQWILRGR